MEKATRAAVSFIRETFGKAKRTISIRLRNLFAVRSDLNE